MPAVGTQLTSVLKLSFVENLMPVPTFITSIIFAGSRMNLHRRHRHSPLSHLRSPPFPLRQQSTHPLSPAISALHNPQVLAALTGVSPFEGHAEQRTSRVQRVYVDGKGLRQPPAEGGIQGVLFTCVAFPRQPAAMRRSPPRRRSTRLPLPKESRGERESWKCNSWMPASSQCGIYMPKRHHYIGPNNTSRVSRMPTRRSKQTHPNRAIVMHIHRPRSPHQ